MKHIAKTVPPASFTTWLTPVHPNWNPTWADLQNPQKRELLISLINDQYGLCAYCECEISTNTAHIEHIKPRSAHPNLQLTFQNLIASCQKEVGKGTPLTCGKAKDDWYNADIYLDPTEPASEAHLTYSADGKVSCLVTSIVHNDFITKLNLNENFKVQSRKEIYDSLNEVDLTADEVREWLNEYTSINNGTLSPFQSTFKFAAKELWNID